jgi:hypothetical protein
VRVVARFAASGASGEDPGALDDDVDLLLGPGEFGRIAFRQGQNLLAVDDQVRVGGGYRTVEAAVNAVVLQQRSQHLVVSQIVDCDDFEFIFPCGQNSESQSADTAKTIDSDTNWHDAYSYRQLAWQIYKTGD